MQGTLKLLTLRWPLPALGGWALAWASFVALGAAGAPPLVALALAGAAPLWLALRQNSRWRQMLVMAGFPASALALGFASTVPVWAWPLLLLLLLAAYPLRAWHDAPFFPTAADALEGVSQHVRLPAQARVLDAGCGAGHGLQALARVWPKAQLHGIEWSRPLAALARWRCPTARIERGDMWAQDWRGFDLVYLFQRPESMARAWQKAQAELPPGAWLLSLEFAVPGVAATAQLAAPGRRTVWIYRR